MADACCADKTFDGVSSEYRRALVVVIAINVVMFIVEIAAGAAAGSKALQADALDFAGDAATYGLSLAVIGASVKTRATASLVKAASLAAFAGFILFTTGLSFISGEIPNAGIISGVGLLALLANLASVFILLRWRDGDSNVRSVWLCSRNDAIGNLAVIAAGALVAMTGSRFPDLLVAAALAGLFLTSAAQITRRAMSEQRNLLVGQPAPAGDACAADRDQPTSVSALK